MKNKSKRGLDRSYRHVLSLVLSMVILVVDAVTLNNSIKTFDDLLTMASAFFIAGLLYYVLVRVVVEVLNFIGK